MFVIDLFLLIMHSPKLTFSMYFAANQNLNNFLNQSPDLNESEFKLQTIIMGLLSYPKSCKENIKNT